jgi:hypothetical protein
VSSPNKAVQMRGNTRAKKTRSAYAVAARLTEFIQERLRYDTIADSIFHGPTFREILNWAYGQMGNPSVEEIERWKRWAPDPYTQKEDQAS